MIYGVRVHKMTCTPIIGRRVMSSINKLVFAMVMTNILSGCGGSSSGSSVRNDDVISDGTIDTSIPSDTPIPSESPLVTTSSYMTTGANKLSEDNSDKVWRFAIIPDTQGAWDDDYTQTIEHTYDDDGDITTADVTLSIDIGYDVNSDNIFDGSGWRIDVSDPYNAFFSDEQGNALASGDIPVAIATGDRRDNPYDFKHLPALFVDPMISKMLQEGVSVALAVGDMTDVRTENEYVEWMDKIATPLSVAGVSILPVRGNHEIVDGNDWINWFTADVNTDDTTSVNNMDNGIDAYDETDENLYDQGYKLYQQYPGSLLAQGLSDGTIVGYREIEDLMYYTIKNNTLFIAVDFYASDLVSVAYEGTWILIYDWLKNILETHATDVDHIVMFGHEPLSTKKRPSVYDYDDYYDYLNSLSGDGDSAGEPGILGLDTGQLGYLALQDESVPGLMDNVLNLLSDYKVTYIAGHDHQYSRSMIHPNVSNPSKGFMQVIAGNASWKAYNNRYGINTNYETGLAQDNFVQAGDYEGSNSLYTKQLTKYEKSNKISFVIAEVNGRHITYTNYWASVNFSEADLTMGTYWSESKNAWIQYDVDANGITVEEMLPIEWHVGDRVSYTTDALYRLVSPYESYWTVTSTPDNDEYIGTEAAILDGFNLTYNSVEVLRADTQGNKQTGKDVNYLDELGTGKGEYTSFAEDNNIPRRKDNMSERLSLSWFVDDNDETISDILLIDGILNQDGTYKNTNGFVQNVSSSQMFFDKDAVETINPTTVIRDGSVIKGEDFADAMTLAITAPATVDLTTLTIGYYNEDNSAWQTFLSDECFTQTAYSDDFSVMYQSGAGGLPSDVADTCGVNIWGYNHNNHTVWGFIHTDGRFALINKTVP